jgi:hypothetical protein
MNIPFCFSNSVRKSDADNVTNEKIPSNNQCNLRTQASKYGNLKVLITSCAAKFTEIKAQN